MSSFYIFLIGYIAIMAVGISIIEFIIFKILLTINDKKIGNEIAHEEEKFMFLKVLLANAVIIFMMYLMRYVIKYKFAAIIPVLPEAYLRILISSLFKFMILCGLVFKNRTSGFFLTIFVIVLVSTSVAYIKSPEVMKVIYATLIGNQQQQK